MLLLACFKINQNQKKHWNHKVTCEYKVQQCYLLLFFVNFSYFLNKIDAPWCLVARHPGGEKLGANSWFLPPSPGVISSNLQNNLYIKQSVIKKKQNKQTYNWLTHPYVHSKAFTLHSNVSVQWWNEDISNNLHTHSQGYKFTTTLVNY